MEIQKATSSSGKCDLTWDSPQDNATSLAQLSTIRINTNILCSLNGKDKILITFNNPSKIKDTYGNELSTSLVSGKMTKTDI